MPLPIAKIQSTITDLLPIPPILTRDQCEILSEQDNVVSTNHLTLKNLNIEPSDVEEEMGKWLWRYKEGGQFAKQKLNGIFTKSNNNYFFRGNFCFIPLATIFFFSIYNLLEKNLLLTLLILFLPFFIFYQYSYLPNFFHQLVRTH